MLHILTTYEAPWMLLFSSYVMLSLLLSKHIGHRRQIIVFGILVVGEWFCPEPWRLNYWMILPFLWICTCLDQLEFPRNRLAMVLKAVSIWCLPMAGLHIFQGLKGMAMSTALPLDIVYVCDSAMIALLLVMICCPPFIGLLVDILNLLPAALTFQFLFILFIQKWRFIQLDILQLVDVSSVSFDWLLGIVLLGVIAVGLRQFKERYLLNISYRTYALLLCAPFLVVIQPHAGAPYHIMIICAACILLWLHSYAVLTVHQHEAIPDWETWSGLGHVRASSAVLMTLETGLSNLILFLTGTHLLQAGQSDFKWLDYGLICVGLLGLIIMIRMWGFFFGKPPSSETVHVGGTQFQKIVWGIVGMTIIVACCLIVVGK